jgi:tetratricopeptide (TPR) repeat protein
VLAVGGLLWVRKVPEGKVGPIEPVLREMDSRLRNLRQDTGTPIVIVGLDGMDWQIAEPLMDRGLLPNLTGLRRRGAWGNIKALTPILSPLLWTSVATGVKADRHGILDFLVRDASSGERVPVNSRFRKVRALWNLFSDAGLSVDIVAWWATWPAEPVRGHMISDRVAYSLFDVDLPHGESGITYPASYFDDVRRNLVSDGEISHDEIVRFIDVSPEQLRSARARLTDDPASSFRDPINHLARILASTHNYHHIALDLLGEGQADLTAVYYQMIDEVGHRFMHFMPPRLDGVDPADVRRFGQAVKRAYEYQDRLLGELLETIDPDSTVIVLSDHGFINGADRPQGETADIEGKPGKWHRPYGVLVLAGPPIEPGELDTTSLLDIAPTVLYLAGVPVADDLDGRVLSEAIRPAFRERFRETRVATYETTPFHPQEAATETSASEVDAEVVARLRALGYVSGSAGHARTAEAAPSTEATEVVTAHTNLAAVLLSSNDLEGAEREILTALSMQPRYPVARRQLFTVRLRQERFDDALRIAEGLLSEADRLDASFLAHVADAYDAAGRTHEGIRALSSYVDGGKWWLGGALSRLLWRSGDHERAAEAARAVLARDPLNEPAMITLMSTARLRGQLASLRPLLESALDSNPRSVTHLNWLAVVHDSTGEVQRAEELLSRALEVDPDHGGAMANLGAFYGRHGRVEDAVPLLRRALRIAPKNVEARINLGSALARRGDLREAVTEFELVVEGGHHSTDIYNAIARAHIELGDLASAEPWLRRSLELDPGQEAVRKTVQQLEARRGAR